MRKALTSIAIGAGLAVALWAPSAAPAADGTFNNAFSTDGRLAIGDGINDFVTDVAPLSDGRVAVLGGFNGGTVALVKADGTLDTSFSTDGFATVPVADPTEIAVQADGKIVVAGRSGASAPFTTGVVRLTVAGPADATFGGGDGFVAVDQPGGNDLPTDVAVGPSGEIVVAGTLVSGSTNSTNVSSGLDGSNAPHQFTLAKLTGAGVADSTFSGNGLADFNLDPNSSNQANFANAVTVQGDGRIVAAGAVDVNDTVENVPGSSCTSGGVSTGDCDEVVEGSFAVIRVTAAGVLDSTFAGGTGTSYPNVVTGTVDCDNTFFDPTMECSKQIEEAEDVKVESDGQLVVGGWVDSDPDPDIDLDGTPNEQQEIDFAAVRLNSNGSVDNAGFGGGDGRVITAIAPDAGPGQDTDEAQNVDLQGDGKILLTGDSLIGGQRDFAVVRYEDDGDLDTSWDGDSNANGKLRFAVVAPQSNSENQRGAALMPNGSLLVGGTGTGQGVFAMLKTDGTEPNTAIITGPGEGSTTSDNTPTFTFFAGVSETGATFQCRYGAASFVACTSPYTKALANGPHTFQVRAIDAAGNIDPTPDTRNFTVSAAAVPETSLTSPGTSPGAYTADTTPTFNFVSASATGIECALVAGHALASIEDVDFSSCAAGSSGSFTPSALADGEYTFGARGLNAAGTDPTPATFELEVDTDAPNGVIVQAPSGTIEDHNPQFQVSTDEPDDIADGEFTMTCELTGALAQSTPCGAAPFSFAQALPDGSYTFTLEVEDLLGRQDTSPATATFTVTTPQPPPPPPNTGGGTQTTPTTPTTPATKRCKKGQKLKKGRCVKKKRKKR